MAPRKERALKRNLNFTSSNYEKEYSESKLPTQNLVLRIFSLYSIFVSATTFFLNANSNLMFTPYFYGFRIGQIVLTPLICFINRLKPLFVEYLLFIQFLYTFFTLAETFKKNMEFGWKVPYFALGMYIEILALALIMAKIGWIKNIIFILTINIVCSFRYLNFEDNFIYEFIPIFHLALNTVILGILSFFIEKTARASFFVNKNKEFELSCFKDLIKDVFPNPIIITQGQKLLFINQETQRTFACESETELQECFKNFLIDTQFNGYPCSLQDINGSSYQNLKLHAKEKSINNIESFLNGIKDLEEFSFLEFLSKSSEIVKTKEPFLINLRGVYTNKFQSANFYFDLKIKNVVWEDKFAMMIILSDNKTLKTIQVLKSQATYKDNLLATVSHDLRTPLNGIIGMLEETMSLLTDRQIKKNLNVSLRSAKNLLFMINDILDFHQISKGKLRLNFEYFSLWELIQDVSKLIKFQAKLKGLNFVCVNKVSEEDYCKAYIRSDANRIRQVILNLLGNAMKFTPTGSITISLETIAEMGLDYEEFNRNSYLIRVVDTGVGIKKEDQNKLFKLFGKLDPGDRNMNKSGVGLGLAISQNLVKILNRYKKNGEIKVISEIGIGSCFYFPINSNNNEKSCENLTSNISEPEVKTVYIKENKKFLKLNAVAENEHATLNKKINILIVEDDQINIMVLCSYLKSFDFSHHELAFNGLQAIEKVKEKADKGCSYDLVLMDCNMPIMDGFEATRQIRNLIKSKLIPETIIIACTANAAESDHNLCFQAGMNDYMTKPYSKSELLTKIKKFIKV